MKKLAIMALAITLLLPVAANSALVVKDGDPAFFVSFADYGGTADIFAGQTLCFDTYPTNFGFVSSCGAEDTFCVVVSNDSLWDMYNDFAYENFGEELIIPSGSYYSGEVCITAPCDVEIGETNTFYALMCYTDTDGICAPDSGDCEDPNIYGGDPYYSLETMVLTVVESPPALSILQDTLAYIEQGQTVGYIPFGICNGDPCAPPVNYDYTITSLGLIGVAVDIADSVTDVPGGDCATVYAVLNAGASDICDYDTLTIIAWDVPDGALYDTCVQAVHVVEPVPVPLFTAPVVTILVLAMILAAAVIMKRHAVSKA